MFYVVKDRLRELWWSHHLPCGQQYNLGVSKLATPLNHLLAQPKKPDTAASPSAGRHITASSLHQPTYQALQNFSTHSKPFKYQNKTLLFLIHLSVTAFPWYYFLPNHRKLGFDIKIWPFQYLCLFWLLPKTPRVWPWEDWQPDEWHGPEIRWGHQGLYNWQYLFTIPIQCQYLFLHF